MAYVRYQSPDDTSFLVFDQSRFRLDHGQFLLELDPLIASLLSRLEEQREWNLEAMKLVQEHRRIEACVEWLETLDRGNLELVAIPGLRDEPALDLVANALIVERQYSRVFCEPCCSEFFPEEIQVVPWSFTEDGVTIEGRRSVCPRGHTLHVMTEGIDAPEIELED